MDHARLAIIGGGIAGLTLANFLEQAQLDYQLYEAAVDYTPKGLGIWLGINAMQVMRRLGLAEAIYERATHLEALRLMDQKGGLLRQLDLSQFKTLEEQVVCLSRQDLQALLLKGIPTKRLKTGKALQEIDFATQSLTLTFTDGHRSTCDLLIGADGLKSRVRQLLFPTYRLRPNAARCFRGIACLRLPESFRRAGNEVWAGGDLFGFCHIQPEEVFWWSIKQQPKAEIRTLQDIQDAMAHFPEIVEQIIAATDVRSRLHAAELPRLPFLKRHAERRICLLGDAANAMRPNLGQGGSMAIESAYYLANCLMQTPDSESAFIQYEKQYRSKLHWVKQQSAWVGRLSALSHPVIVGLRNLGLRLTPANVAAWQLASIYRLKSV